MPDSPDKIQWHPAFYAATELELRDDIEEQRERARERMQKWNDEINLPDSV